jgi:RHS repeat-associated protein
LELNDQAGIISYEEYHPYGTTAYRVMNSSLEAPPKRYRYTGKERDDESGFYYHGARYYAPWLGIWTSCDPIGLAENVLDLYVYARSNPICYHDLDGQMPDGPTDPKVLALGLSKTPEELRGLEGVVTVAEQNLPGQNVIDITKMPSWATSFEENFGTNAPGEIRDVNKFGAEVAGNLQKFKGLGSAVSVQEALEGGGGVTGIHFDVRGVDLTKAGHTGSELRSVVATLAREANSEVDIHMLSEKGLSTIQKGTSIVSGASLPERIAEKLPPSFRNVATVDQVAEATQGLTAAAEQTAEAAGSQTAAAAQSLAQTAVSTASSWAGAAKNALTSVVPGAEELKLAGGGSLTAGVAVARAYAANSIRAAAQVVVTKALAAGRAVVAAVEAAGAAEATVAGGAVVAAAGSVVLLGTTVYAAAKGQETPIDVADQSLGSHLGDIAALGKDINLLWKLNFGN